MGHLFGGPYNKVYSILGSILGYPTFGKHPSPTDPSSKSEAKVQPTGELQGQGRRFVD